MHISFVRSVNLDEWKQEHVEVRSKSHRHVYIHLHEPSCANDVQDPLPAAAHTPTTPPMMPQQMERWGNARARAYFEAEVPPGYARPSDWSNVHQMTRWIKVRTCMCV